MQNSPIFLVFSDSEGNWIDWSPEQLVQDGTPIGADGEDMTYIGWKPAT